MGSNVPHVGCHESRLDFDAIEDYSDKAWLIVIDKTDYFLPKLQVRVYHNTKKLYAPNWLLEEKGLL